MNNLILDHIIQITDNACSNDLLAERQLASLAPYAGISLSELNLREKQLLIFPECLGAHEDGIGDQNLFDIVGGRLRTGNMMGFFSVNGISVAIHSRFDISKSQYFLHYMLKKVFGMNLLNLTSGIDDDPLWEFLIYLFPYCLTRALRQGLFKAYRHFQYNDAKLRGSIDIARHLKLNLPFCGKIAYHTRELSANNFLMQLIRHTIEFIGTDKQSSSILNRNAAIRDAVSEIITATPSYLRQDRRKMIDQNLRGVCHPYFTEYTALQKLCLQILRHEKITYGQDDRQICGVVFDGAWLWEEYLATLLTNLGFEHPENKTGRGKKYLYTDHHSGWFYPDFMQGKIVLDAKYKKLENGISREDRYQIISYLHVLKAELGGFIYPVKRGKEEDTFPKTLNGHGGVLHSIPLEIPSGCAHWDEFNHQIRNSENIFLETIQKFQQEYFCPLEECIISGDKQKTLPSEYLKADHVESHGVVK